MRLHLTAMLLLITVMLTGCATLGSGFEKPQVNVTSFSVAPESVGGVPRFHIGVQVINPNRTALTFKGMSYSLEVEGRRVLSGATADIPAVPAYGMADFVVEASPDLMGSVHLLGDLFSRQRNSLGFTFKARLDAGSVWPFINVKESGRFTLPGN